MTTTMTGPGPEAAIIGAATLARANAGNYVGGLRGLWKDPRILYIALFASLVCSLFFDSSASNL
jgi:hypothetical protein